MTTIRVAWERKSSSTSAGNDGRRMRILTGVHWKGGILIVLDDRWTWISRLRCFPFQFTPVKIFLQRISATSKFSVLRISKLQVGRASKIPSVAPWPQTSDNMCLRTVVTSPSFSSGLQPLEQQESGLEILSDSLAGLQTLKYLLTDRLPFDYTSSKFVWEPQSPTASRDISSYVVKSSYTPQDSLKT